MYRKKLDTMFNVQKIKLTKPHMGDFLFLYFMIFQELKVKRNKKEG